MRTVTESPDALIIAETTSVGSADPAVDCAGVARNLRFNGMSCRKDPTHVECLEVRPDFQLTEQDETYQWIRQGSKRGKQDVDVNGADLRGRDRKIRKLRVDN